MSAGRGFLMGALCGVVLTLLVQSAIPKRDSESPSAAVKTNRSVPEIDTPTRTVDATHREIRLEPIHSLTADDSVPIHSACFSQDGRTTFVAAGRRIDVIETETWNRRQLLTGHRDTINRLRLSPDGGRLASAGDDKLVQIWIPGDEGWEVDRTLFLDAPARRLEWSPNGRWLVVGLTGSAMSIVDCNTWEMVHALSIPIVPNTFAFAPNSGKMLAAGFAPATSDDPCAILNMETLTWTIFKERPAHRVGIEKLAWNRDGSRLYSASADMTLQCWTPQTDETRKIVTLPHAATTLNLLGDERYALVSWHFGHVAIVDLERGTVKIDSTGHLDVDKAMVGDAVVSADRRLAVTCANADMGRGAGTVKVWSLAPDAAQ